MSEQPPEGTQTPLTLNRSRNCSCCSSVKVRFQIRVGKSDDPDYAIAFCPKCDVRK